MNTQTAQTKEEPKVLNKYKDTIPGDAVYIGRPSKWGNPFKVGVDGTRGECAKLFSEWIVTQPQLVEQVKRELKGKSLVCYCAPAACHGDTLLKIANEKTEESFKKPLFSWKRRGGYECSTKGDIRLSALRAVLEDGRTVEMHYQCDCKGFDPGGKRWQLGKGKRPNRDISHEDLYKEYKELWRRWVLLNFDVFLEVADRTLANHDGVLSDMFAKTNINQARALSELMNEYID